MVLRGTGCNGKENYIMLNYAPAISLSYQYLRLTIPQELRLTEACFPIQKKINILEMKIERLQFACFGLQLTIKSKVA